MTNALYCIHTPKYSKPNWKILQVDTLLLGNRFANILLVCKKTPINSTYYFIYRFSFFSEPYKTFLKKGVNFDLCDVYGLCEKCPNKKFFSSVFSLIQIRKTPYLYTFHPATPREILNGSF